MNLAKEISLARICFRMKFMDRMEDVVTFVFLNLGVVLRLGLSIIFFQAIFAQVDVIGGWSFAEVLVLLGTWEFMHNIAWATYFRGGFRRMPVFMQRGELDMLLTRPINLRTFFIYDNNDLFFSSPQIIASLGLVIYGASISQNHLNIIIYILLVFTGLIIHYSLVVILSAINFWTIIEHGGWLFGELTELGRYPITIYKGVTRLALTIAVPVACMYTFPVAALFGNIKISEYGILIGVLIFFLLFSNYIWNRGLRRYESTGY